METLRERIDNLAMFLSELQSGKIPLDGAKTQADYHIATLDQIVRRYKPKQKCTGCGKRTLRLNDKGLCGTCIIHARMKELNKESKERGQRKWLLR